MPAPIRVLIVDDSAAVREALTEVFQADPGISVMTPAANPVQAVRRIKEEIPDVITLDVEMPEMDGVTFLRRIMKQHPIPVVMCSTLMEKDSKALVDALAAGAVDAIQKPKFDCPAFFEEARQQICETVRNASRARPKAAAQPLVTEKKRTADEVIPPARRKVAKGEMSHMIAVGSSTGGTEALEVFLAALPADAPPTVVVQHMPGGFTGAFASRLNDLCAVDVFEARHGDVVQQGQVAIAPGGVHCLVGRNGGQYRIELRDGPLVARHKPSADVLFRSVARSAGANAVGVILTGMGDDGARGLKEMRDLGARTIGQDEATSVVYGMPKAAFEAGAVEFQLPLKKIASFAVPEQK